jgi:hypothetical protein
MEGSGDCLIQRRYTGIRLEELRKTAKILRQDSRSPGRDLNPGPTEYETGVLATRPQRVCTHACMYYACIYF